MLKGLVLPAETAEELDAVDEPEDLRLRMFPDPTAANVFCLAGVVRDMEQVTPDAFAPYFEKKAS